MRPCQSFRVISLSSRRVASGLRQPAGIAGFLEKLGSAPHPGLSEGLLPGTRSFIHPRTHPATALAGSHFKAQQEAGRCETFQNEGKFTPGL